MINFDIKYMKDAISGRRHVLPKGLTREQFKEWMSGRLKVQNEGFNVNPRLAFNPLPSMPPKAPPSAKESDK